MLSKEKINQLNTMSDRLEFLEERKKSLENAYMTDTENYKDVISEIDLLETILKES